MVCNFLTKKKKEKRRRTHVVTTAIIRYLLKYGKLVEKGNTYTETEGGKQGVFIVQEEQRKQKLQEQVRKK